MESIFRDSTVGGIIRFLLKNRVLQYPEERSDFDLPDIYKPAQKEQSSSNLRPLGDNVLVDWNDANDTTNPQNWSTRKKNFVCVIICVYTFVVYCGSAIYTTGQKDVEERFNVTVEASSLPLSLYVLAYGIGPLIWAPLSENPSIGRNPVYAVTFSIFFILSIATALVDNFAGLLVLRFLQGFFGSPCLANGVATLGDIFHFSELPYAVALWTTAAYCGPALGPLLSGFAVTAKGWRWSLWEIVWMSSPVLLVMLLCLPETSPSKILLCRARRLRKYTDNKHLRSYSEIQMKHLNFFVFSMVKPIEIMAKDPAIFFINLYTSFVYGVYYSFFEVFPLVYTGYYGFSLGEIGIVFTCVIIGALIALAIYSGYIRWIITPDLERGAIRSPEHRLVPALFACFGLPAGLFLFAWTSQPNINWISPTIGITIYAGSFFIVLQCIFIYVPMSYPQYAASLFAGNDFCRSAIACGSIMFARPLFLNLGVPRGVSLLGGISCMGIGGIWALYCFGKHLRAKSTFAVLHLVQG